MMQMQNVQNTNQQLEELQQQVATTEEWQDLKEYVVGRFPSYYVRTDFKLSEFSEEVREIIKEIVREDVKRYAKEIEENVSSTIKHIKDRGYSEREIKVVNKYRVGVKNEDIVYELDIVVATPHFKKIIMWQEIARTGEASEISLLSSGFSKERNTLGSRVIEEIKELKIKKKDEEIKKLKEELEMLKNIVRKLVNEEELQIKLEELEEEKLTKQEIEYLLKNVFDC